MSLNLSNSFHEKINLIIKLIDMFLNEDFSSDEIHHLLEVFVYADISKDKCFKGTKVLEEIQEVVNIEFAFYTSNLEYLKDSSELFGEERLREILLELKNKLILEI